MMILETEKTDNSQIDLGLWDKKDNNLQANSNQEQMNSIQIDPYLRIQTG